MILVMLMRVRVQMNLTTAGSFLGISCFRFSFISYFFGDKIYWLKPSVALAWLVVYLQFTSCTQGWHTKLLRDRSLHLLAKGSVTTWQFSKKNVVSVHAPELPFCIALNHLTRTLNTHHRTATTIYLLQHWSDRGYVGNLNPKQA